MMTPGQLSLRPGYPSEWTLARWRRENIGPPYRRLIGRVYYALDDLEAWERSQASHPKEINPQTQLGRKLKPQEQEQKS